MYALSLAQSISTVRERIAEAAVRAGRRPEDVLLVAVSKGVAVEAIEEALAAGLTVFGESKVQEAEEKARALRGRNVRWHMVGHLQRNKAGPAVRLFDLIHSVDSVRLLEALEGHAAEAGRSQPVLIQVNLAGEESKYGVPEEKLGPLAEAARVLEKVRVEGLMTIPPFDEDPEKSRPLYRRLRELAERYGFRHLSMGMSGDFEVAVEEGATMVRVGTVLFGERQYA
ncbi:MAG: YggS family pyridoxal phosphate-dependent enzyme [Nitrospirota bacterium]